MDYLAVVGFEGCLFWLAWSVLLLFFKLDVSFKLGKDHRLES